MNKKEVILSISGHDPSGGAGLQTDILTSNFLIFIAFLVLHVRQFKQQKVI